MLVLHVDGSGRWGGGQNQVRLLMRELAGYSVEQVCLCPAGSPLSVRLNAEGLPVQTVRWEGGADFRVSRAVYRQAKTADIVHCHDGHALQLSLLPARLRRKPVVATRRVHFRARPRVWNRATRVIAITEAVKRRLLECAVDEARIRVIPDGIDIDEVRSLPLASPGLRDRLAIPADTFVAGNVGALFEFKNQKIIPRAAAHERRIIWTIIGDGPERPVIEAAIAAHGVGVNMRLAGAASDARLYIREFDVFIFTSKGEGLGTSILDAMALDVPVIAFADAGPGEVLGPVHEQTGCSLVPPDDAAGLAAAVRRVCDNPELRERMILAQRVRLEDFRIQGATSRTVALYHELLARP